MDLQHFVQKTRISQIALESAVFLILVQVVSGLIINTILAPSRPAHPLPVPPRPSVAHRLEPARDIRRLVARASSGTARVLATRPGPGRLTTVLVRVHHAPLVVLTNGRYLFLGPVFGASGHNLQKQAQASMADNTTAQALATSLPPPPRAPGPALTAAPRATVPFPSASNASFVVGRAGPTVTMVADPNCAFCHAMWVSVLWPAIQSGDLRVRVVPVGIVDPRQAIVRAADILASPNPARSWVVNEQRFHVATEQGGWPAAGPFNPADPPQRAVLTNTEAFFASEGGSVATPTFFFHGRTHVGIMTAQAFRRFLSP